MVAPALATGGERDVLPRRVRARGAGGADLPVPAHRGRARHGVRAGTRRHAAPRLGGGRPGGVGQRLADRGRGLLLPRPRQSGPGAVRPGRRDQHPHRRRNASGVAGRSPRGYTFFRVASLSWTGGPANWPCSGSGAGPSTRTPAARTAPAGSARRSSGPSTRPPRAAAACWTAGCCCGRHRGRSSRRHWSARTARSSRPWCCAARSSATRRSAGYTRRTCPWSRSPRRPGACSA